MAVPCIGSDATTLDCEISVTRLWEVTAVTTYFSRQNLGIPRRVPEFG